MQPEGSITPPQGDCKFEEELSDLIAGEESSSAAS